MHFPAKKSQKYLAERKKLHTFATTYKSKGV